MPTRTTGLNSVLEKRSVPRLLGELNLSAAKLHALKQSGFVTAETRGRNRVTFRLHGRLAGRQFSRHLGSDPQSAQAVGEALATWQAGRRAKKRIRLLVRQSQALLRSIKPQLAQYVAASGFKYHGRRIRKPRPISPSSATQSEVTSSLLGDDSQ